MKGVAEMSASPVGPIAAAPPARESTVYGAVAQRSRDFLTLTKPRLNLLVLITALGGMYLAAPEGVAPLTLLHALIGTALVAGGASALNQVW